MKHVARGPRAVIPRAGRIAPDASESRERVVEGRCPQVRAFEPYSVSKATSVCHTDRESLICKTMS